MTSLTLSVTGNNVDENSSDRRDGIPYTTLLANPIENVIPQLPGDLLLAELEEIERAKQGVSEALKALDQAHRAVRDAKNAAKKRVRELYTEAEVFAADGRVVSMIAMH